ncbi:hypothetical protein BDN67DRAFT_864976, partial [Paxillus ammoniavirescens]
RTNVLSPYPHVIQVIMEQLRMLHAAGIALSAACCRGIIVAQLQHHLPQIFAEKSQDGSVFCCSDSWIRNFLHDNLHWCIRKSTRTAQKLP